MIAAPQPSRGTLVGIDDHARFRAAARELLAAAGWQIVGVASTGAAGLDLVARLAPDVVLLDVVLPGMDPVRGVLAKEMLSGNALAALLAGGIPALGGQLTIASPAGHGTTIRAELPCG